jgi:hypothetical protein
MFALQKLIVLRFCNPKENPLIQRKQTLPKKHNILKAPGTPRGLCFAGIRRNVALPVSTAKYRFSIKKILLTTF